MTTTIISAWLLTYLLHSTIILSAALAASHLLGGRHLAVQETLLRTALVGGIVTASLQLGLGIVPAAGEVSLGATVHPAVAAVIGPEPAVASESPLIAPFSPGFEANVWATPLVTFWATASILALVAVGRSVLDLRRLLKSRCFEPAGRLVESLAAAMGLRQKVRISTSKAVAVPFATGIRRPEICCPEHVADLALEHKRGLFAHELAHLVRRDPAWQLTYRLGEALLVVQPLNRLVRRRLEDLAEHLADDRAVAGTGDRLGLARCLVVVAHWGRSGDIGLPATALASGPRLDRRVRRLISRSAESRIDGRWAAAVGVAALTASTLLLPVVATSPVHAGSAEISVAETRTWSDAEDRPTETAPVAEPAPEPPPAPAAPADIPEATEAPPSPASSPSAPTRPWASRAPEAPPTPETPATATTSEAPTAVPVPRSVPAPAAPRVPAKAAEPSTPPPKASTEEAERRRTDTRQRESERAQERALAEACAQRQRETARAQSERARALAREAADRARLTHEEIAEMQIRTRQLDGEARRLVREAAVAERDRFHAARAEALELARQSALRARQLTDEQREAMRRQAVEMRKRAEAGQLEAQNLAEKRARELADRARALAEQAEAERRDPESHK